MAEEGAQWHSQGILRFVDNDASIDSEIMSGGAFRSFLRKLQDHVRTLLLDTKCRDLRAGNGFDTLNDRGQCGTTPILDLRTSARFHPHSFLRQELSHDLDVLRIADFQYRRSRGDHCFAFLRNAQHLASARTRDRDGQGDR